MPNFFGPCVRRTMSPRLNILVRVDYKNRDGSDSVGFAEFVTVHKVTALKADPLCGDYITIEKTEVKHRSEKQKARHALT